MCYSKLSPFSENRRISLSEKRKPSESSVTSNSDVFKNQRTSPSSSLSSFLKRASISPDRPSRLVVVLRCRDDRSELVVFEYEYVDAEV